MKRLPLASFRLQSFKAVRDSGTVRFGPLTVFIGNNGSGKSSLVEGLETFRDIVVDGLDSAMRRWRGFEHVWNHAVEHPPLSPYKPHGHAHPMQFRVHLAKGNERIAAEQQINIGFGGNRLFIQKEESFRRSKVGSERLVRDAEGVQYLGHGPGKKQLIKSDGRIEDGRSILRDVVNVGDSLKNWQFLTLMPDAMAQPVPQQRAADRVRLSRNGANVAEYLNEIRDRDLDAFNGIVEAVRYVLPFAADLQPALTSELERAFYLKLKEKDFEVPGWLLSTGTLRIVALLACLRHPDPPLLLVVEEVENGLDPRTLQMLVSEIQETITAGTTQVILTTHSPYLLDLLHLSHIVVVERDENNEPKFRRPSDEKELLAWAKEFSPGQLYTMGRLTRSDQK